LEGNRSPRPVYVEPTMALPGEPLLER
jgi:hypothetical protein